jgi:hypothetical protein
MMTMTMTMTTTMTTTMTMTAALPPYLHQNRHRNPVATRPQLPAWLPKATIFSTCYFAYACQPPRMSIE